jgi:hypothetical protein
VEGPSKLCRPTKGIFVVVLDPRSHLNSTQTRFPSSLYSQVNHPLVRTSTDNGNGLTCPRLDTWNWLINAWQIQSAKAGHPDNSKLLWARWVHQQVRLKCQAATIAQSLINPTWCINMSYFLIQPGSFPHQKMRDLWIRVSTLVLSQWQSTICLNFVVLVVLIVSLPYTIGTSCAADNVLRAVRREGEVGVLDCQCLLSIPEESRFAFVATEVSGIVSSWLQ